MAVSAWIKSAVFSDGREISFNPGEIVLLVGPNNSGKSRALSELSDKCVHGGRRSGLVVRTASFGKQGTFDELVAHLRENFKGPTGNDDWAFSFQGSNFQGEERLEEAWENPELSPLQIFFAQHLLAENRLQLSDPSENVKLDRAPLRHPIQHLAKDQQLEDRVSDAFFRAFAMHLVVHRNAGNRIPLYCGQKRPEPSNERLSTRYHLNMEQNLLELAGQGHGVRAYAGLLLNIMYGPLTITLLDEPETFLDPPRARKIGKLLAQDKPKERQVFVATHSGEILRGVLDAANAQVSVLRITREYRQGNDINVVANLRPEDVKRLWNDPLLRYSNTLDGVFHEKVAVCEADADCRFYGALLDALYEDRRDRPRPDVMFTHCGGTSRMPTVLQALRNLDVPVVAIVDFDVFRNEQPFRRLIEALDEEWDEFERDWRVIKHFVDQRRPPRDADWLKGQFEVLLGDHEKSEITDELLDKIRSAIRRLSPWDEAKRLGIRLLAGSSEHSICEDLLGRLCGIGLFVVPFGELESFDPSQTAHGPSFVNAVLERPDLATDPQLETARRFVDAIAGASSTARGRGNAGA